MCVRNSLKNPSLCNEFSERRVSVAVGFQTITVL